MKTIGLIGGMSWESTAHYYRVINQEAAARRGGLHAAPLIVLSGLTGALTLYLLYRRRFGPARFSAVIAVAAVVAGWGIGQYPWLLVDEVTIEQAAGAPATLGALLVAVGLAGVVVLPALAYLYWLTQSEAWSRH